tara:strand:- start:77 stop:409 length:333 start_codon:yes stop_codon:yes gene_type:complete
MRKNLSFLLILLSLLFNIQVGFTHDIEHQYHDNENTEDLHHDSDHHDDFHNKNLTVCEECTFTVTDHSAKTINFSSDFDFSFNQTFQINDNYLVRDPFSVGIVAYQSQAP